METTNNMLLEYKREEHSKVYLVKQILTEHFGLSSRLISKLKNSGGIKVNGEPVTVRYEMHVGDILTLSLEEKSGSDIQMCNIPLDIIYEDQHILAVNKPRAMPTHPSFRHHSDTLANAVMYKFRNTVFTFRAATRLDEDTSGVVLIAKDANTAYKLSLLLQKGEIEKQYVAICDNTPVEKCGTIDAAIIRDKDSVIKRKISPDGKRAITKYKVIKQYSDNSCLIELHPITGRTHQLRLHLSYIGCPIKNDFLYGVQSGNDLMLLHCQRLSFIHPQTNEKLILEAPLPTYFLSQQALPLS